jgi:hypothetical protein
LQAILGADVETLVHTYEHLPWYKADALDRHLADLGSATETTRNALTIRLADELEEWLDLSLALMDRNQVEYRIGAYGQKCIRLAELMELDGLASSMQDAAARYQDLKLPDAVILHRDRAYERPRHHLWEMSAPEGWLLMLVRRIVRSLQHNNASRQSGDRP